MRRVARAFVRDLQFLSLAQELLSTRQVAHRQGATGVEQQLIRLSLGRRSGRRRDGSLRRRHGKRPVGEGRGAGRGPERIPAGRGGVLAGGGKRIGGSRLRLAFDAEGGRLPDERGECNRCSSGSRGPSQLSSPYERRR